MVVSRIDWEAFLGWFLDRLSKVSSTTACSTLFLANAHTLNVACSRPRTLEALHAATLVLNDGIGMDLYARLRFGRPFLYNFAGTDLIPRLFSECARKEIPLRVFLYGSRPGRAAEAARKIESTYAPVRVVGVLDGYFTDAAEACARIDAAHPDLLLVGLGNPLQEEWMAAYAPTLSARVAIGVGALFDFLSGAVPRAPRLIRALRLEWLFRLALEPRRMFRRYVIGIPIFLWRTITYRPSRAEHLVGTSPPAFPPNVAPRAQARRAVVVPQYEEARVSPGLSSPHPDQPRAP